MKTSRIADEDSVSKEIKYIHTYIHTYIQPPCHVAHARGIFANLHVTFKLFLLDSDTSCVMHERFISFQDFQVQLMFSIFRLGLFYND